MVHKVKKTKAKFYARFRLTPNHPLFVEVTLVNDATDSIVYPDLSQNWWFTQVKQTRRKRPYTGKNTPIYMILYYDRMSPCLIRKNTMIYGEKNAR